MYPDPLRPESLGGLLNEIFFCRMAGKGQSSSIRPRYGSVVEMISELPDPLNARGKTV
jgi:hypothetical protein